jgi:signal transduction histidine kinase
VTWALSLTRRYLLFLGLVIVTLLGASYLITANVVSEGLTELFEQRLERSRVVLDQYAEVRMLTRAKELEAVTGSPRFQAAMATGDAGTVAAETPLYASMLGAELFVVADPEGRITFSQPRLDSLTEAFIRSLFLRGPEPYSAHYLLLNGEYFELLLSPVITGDGFPIGTVAAGGHFSASALDDLRRLTGFDVVLSDADRVIAHTLSPAVESWLAADRAMPTSLVHDVIQRSKRPGRAVMSLSLASRPFNATVTFVGSPDDWLAPIEQRISWLLLLLAVGGGLLAMLTIYVVTERRIGRQVGLLVRGAEQIAQGNLAVPIESLSHDELGYLARELETMRLRLREQRRALEQEHQARVNSERHAAIGRLATGIIHDFKNPMTIIRGSVDLMEMKQGTADVSKYYRNIKSQIERMGQLARDILEYSKGHVQLECTQVCVDTFMGEVLEGHVTAFDQAQVTLCREGEAGIAGWFDPLRLRRVVDNLLSNAREALPPGGRVVVRWRLAGAWLHIEVEDNGPGIPVEIRDSLFQPFVTSGKKGGTGLGLAISHKIVEDHGGTLAVESNPSWGTRFDIAIPAYVAADRALQEQTP